MDRRLTLRVFLGLTTAMVLGSSDLGAATPSTRSPSVLPSPEASPFVPLTVAERRALLADFTQRQKEELRVMDRRQKAEMKDLEASQTARDREWKSQERARYMEMSKARKSGAEIRAYVHDRRDRRRALLAIFTDEKNQRKREQDARRRSIIEDQAMRLKEFQQFLDRGERPPSRLWPQF